MSHYFMNDENVKSQKRILYYEFDKVNFSFFSDNGVFSKSEIDEGSKILLNSYLKYGKKGRVLDVGSGIGILGIVISKINDCQVDMLEINKRAVNLCQENILVNKSQLCRVFESDIYHEADGMYDVIVTNPPIRAGKKVVFDILENAKDHLNTKGELWVVIRKNQGADSAKKKMNEVFGNCDIVKRDKGFYILKSIK